MYSENTNKYKQILIDIDNYNALKELGKAGDSFNDVLGELLSKVLNRDNNKENVY